MDSMFVKSVSSFSPLSSIDSQQLNIFFISNDVYILKSFCLQRMINNFKSTNSIRRQMHKLFSCE